MGGWYQGWDGGLGSCLNTPLGPSEITTATLAVAESSITTFFKFENNYSPFRHNENRCWNYWLYLILYTWQALCFGLYLAAWWIILVGRRVMVKIRNVIYVRIETQLWAMKLVYARILYFHLIWEPVLPSVGESFRMLIAATVKTIYINKNSCCCECFWVKTQAVFSTWWKV